MKKLDITRIILIFIIYKSALDILKIFSFVFSHIYHKGSLCANIVVDLGFHINGMG